MAYVWKPVKSPPSARDIPLQSPDIQKVIEVIRSQRDMKHPLFQNYSNLNESGDANLSGSQQQGPKKDNACSSNWVKSNGEETRRSCMKMKKSSNIACELSLQHTKANLKGEQCDHKKSGACGMMVGNGRAIHADILLDKSHVTDERVQNQEGKGSSSTCSTIMRGIQKKRQLTCEDGSETLKKRSATQKVKSHLLARKQYRQSNSVMKQDLDGDMSTSYGDKTNFRNIVLDHTDEKQRALLLDECLAAAEILIQLSYARGFTQLQEKPALEKCSNSTTGGFHGNDTVHSILMAVSCQSPKSPGNHSDDGQWILLSAPILKVSSSQKAWCQQFLSTVLSSGVRKICYDAQEVISVIMSFCQPDFSSVASKWVCLDPQVACWLLDPDNPPINFSDLLTTVLDYKSSGGDQKRIKADARNPAEVSDFVHLSQCMRRLYHRLTEANLWNLFLQVEMPLIPLLAGMEESGIQVNPQKFYYASTILKSRTSQLEQLAHSKAGRAFQLNSHVQLRKILFDELKLDETLTTKQMERTAGQNLKSTSENVLSKLQGVHPLPGIILEYRKMQKLKSTYVDGFIDFVRDNKIHCTWEQTAAVSGRLQSTNPNVQNIPKQPVSVNLKKSKDGAHRILHMREPFVSREGHSLISADFQSIELRLLAHFSNDDLLLGVFRDEDQTDIFIQMASQWLGVPSDEVKDEDREKTKRIVYSIVYGAGSEKIAEILKIDKTTAKSFTNSFLDKFSGIRRFTHQSITQCRRLGYVRSLLQRRRLIENISSSNTPQRLHAERQAVNFIIQGSAADVCKLAMLTTTREFAERPHLKARLLIQIHDELLFEVPDHQINECKVLIATAMESVANISELGVQLKTRIPVSLSIGKDWGHLVKV